MEAMLPGVIVSPLRKLGRWRYKPSSNPLATPQKLHTAVQEKSQKLKISRGHDLMASTVPLSILGCVVLMMEKGSTDTMQ